MIIRSPECLSKVLQHNANVRQSTSMLPAKPTPCEVSELCVASKCIWWWCGCTLHMFPPDDDNDMDDLHGISNAVCVCVVKSSMFHVRLMSTWSELWEGNFSFSECLAGGCSRMAYHTNSKYTTSHTIHVNMRVALYLPMFPRLHPPKIFEISKHRAGAWHLHTLHDLFRWADEPEHDVICMPVHISVAPSLLKCYYICRKSNHKRTTKAKMEISMNVFSLNCAE